MDFIEAVKAMKKGKKVKRFGQRPIHNLGHIVFADTEERELYAFGIFDIEATDWEIVKEKKTLSDKMFTTQDTGPFKVIHELHVKAAIKEFLCYLYNAPLREYKDGFSRDVSNKAKEIFGDELL